MLNSSFFLKQLGLVDILKYWYTFVSDPNEKIVFPRFIKPDLAEKVVELASFESREILKELTQELETMRVIVSKEVAPNLKDRMNIFMIKPSEVFSQARKLLKREQFTINDLIEGSRKLQNIIKEEGEDSNFPYKISQNPSLKNIKPVVTESTKGSSTLLAYTKEPQEYRISNFLRGKVQPQNTHQAIKV